MYRHEWVADMEVTDGMWGSDIQAVADDDISVTPIRISKSGVDSEALRQLWE